MVYAGSDPADGENTADHPEVSRFPGFHIDNSKMNDFSEFHFASEGLDDSGEPKGEVKSGKYWFVDYILNDGHGNQAVSNSSRTTKTRSRKPAAA